MNIGTETGTILVFLGVLPTHPCPQHAALYALIDSKSLKCYFFRVEKPYKEVDPFILGVCRYSSWSVGISVSISRLACFRPWAGLFPELWVWRSSFFHCFGPVLFTTQMLGSLWVPPSPPPPPASNFSLYLMESLQAQNASFELKKMTSVQMRPEIHVFISEQLARSCCLLSCLPCIIA